jgi:RNA polymerase sigma factor (TIGR02999 family)
MLHTLQGMQAAQPKRSDIQAPALPEGSPCSASAWFQSLYKELRRRARGELFRHQALTLGPTTLLHEAWMQMERRSLEFASQGELVAYASRTMRGIVIDHIRARQAEKRGSGVDDLPYETLVDLSSMPDREVLNLNDALAALAAADRPLSELVELKFFAGLNFAEIAALRGASERTVQRDWEKARLFLFAALRE